MVVRRRGELRVEDRPVPQPGPGEALVEVAYGGICGSDLHYWLDGAVGPSVLKAPMVLGHEVAGRVMEEALGGGGPPAGTPVTVHPARIMPAPGRFPAGRPNLAPGVAYLGSAARVPHTDGAFSRFVSLPVGMLRVVPGHVPLQVAALAEPASVAWHAVSRLGHLGGQRLVVVGCGPIGALAIAVARRAGAAGIVAVDVSQSALDLAQRCGATELVDGRDATAVAAVDADLTVEASGTAPGLGSALAATTRGGRVVLVGLPPPGDQPVRIAHAVSRELELVGSFRFHEEMDQVLAAMGDGSLEVSPVVSSTYPARSALQAFDAARRPDTGGKVLLRFAEASS